MAHPSRDGAAKLRAWIQAAELPLSVTQLSRPSAPAWSVFDACADLPGFPREALTIVRNIRIADPADRHHAGPAPRPSAATSRLTRSLATLPILLLVPALVVAWFPVAAAAGPGITVSASTVEVGQNLTVRGTDFAHKTSVQLTWDGLTDGMPTVDVKGQGGFRATFIVPPAAAGSSHVVAAVVMGEVNAIAGGEVASATVIIASSVTPPTPVPTPLPTPVPTPVPTPSPTPVPTPTPPPVPTPTPSPTPAAGCGYSLQGLINGAATGSVLQLPNCVFREAATISKALTILGPATIKGSDVWTTWDGNVSLASVPSLPTNGNCTAARCAWPEQVFIDGTPQRQVGSAEIPTAGEFKLDAGRHVVLGSSAAGKTVEVTVRRTWVTISADDVTIDRLTMRHAANGPQSGGIQESSGADRLIVRNSVLSDTHGAVVNFQGTVGSALLNSDVSRGGQLGVHIGGSFTTGVTISGNRIHDNNTEGFMSGWEAGGLKAAVSTDLTLTDNEVYNNDGSGLWCDIRCYNVTFARNRVHHNASAGIFFEISDGAIVMDNVVWENGWSHPAWGWGAGILISSSANAEVRNNVVAWNADGISVISQSRTDAPSTIVGNYVHDNTIALAPIGADTSEKFMVGFLQDWAGVLFDAGSNNRGALNRYWHAQPEPSGRFGWSGTKSRLSDFNATPGDEGGTYLTLAQRDSSLSAAGVPLNQAPH